MEAKTQGYGTIGWALSAVQYGHQMRRRSWPKDDTIVYDAESKQVVLYADDGPVLWTPLQGDLLANDWVMADPVLPGSYAT